MKTFIDLKCENKEEAIKKLEQLAFTYDRVCIYNISIKDSIPSDFWIRDFSDVEQDPWTINYFVDHGIEDQYLDKCTEIISRSGTELEEHDFMFEWKNEPSKEQVKKLEDGIKASLDRINCKYTISNK